MRNTRRAYAHTLPYGSVPLSHRPRSTPPAGRPERATKISPVGSRTELSTHEETVRQAKPFLNKNRYWGNFERFAAVGGKREPLIPKGHTVATDNPAVAQRLFDERWAKLERALDQHQNGLPVVVANPRGVTLVDYAVRYLSRLGAKRDTKGNPVHPQRGLDRRKRSITACLETPTMRRVQFFSRLEPEYLEAMILELGERRKENGERLKASTVRSYAMDFSAMLTAAVRDRLLTTNALPTSETLPQLAERSALDDGLYLMRDELRLLLENVLPSQQVPYAQALAMTLAYTGMRKEEAMTLRVQDINFLTKEIRVNDGKTEAARRKVPLWPKLAAILEPLVHDRPENALVFPSVVATQRVTHDKEQPIDAIDGTLAAAARLAGIRKNVTHHTLRHSYVSARLQMQHRTVTGTLVHVDLRLVVHEIGHADEEMIDRVYGHRTRKRVDQVELDYGEVLPDHEEAKRRAKAARGERIRAGLAARKARGETRRAPGEGSVALTLTPAQQKQRRACAHVIRSHARAHRMTELELTVLLGATPAEVTAIMRGDLGRLPLPRIQQYASKITRAA
jgi:integrase